MAKAKTEPKEQEITLDSLLTNATQSEENVKAMFFKQQGIKEFLQSLKNDGYQIVKVEAEKN